MDNLGEIESCKKQSDEIDEMHRLMIDKNKSLIGMFHEYMIRNHY